MQRSAPPLGPQPARRWPAARLPHILSMVAAIALMGCAATPATPRSTGFAPKGPIEAKYRADGPWAVSTATSGEACDREGNLCDIWYPTDLGTNAITRTRTGFQHPVIAWGNGTGMPPSAYAYYLKHLASWGFIVVASRDTGTTTGDTMLDSARYIIRRGSAAGDIFRGKVDGTRAGATGHSQGGSSVDKLAIDEVAPFKAFVPIHGPDGDGIWGALCCKVKNSGMANLGADTAILFFAGTGDSGNADAARRLYKATSPAATRAVGILAGSKHDDIMGSPACTKSFNCQIGAFGYLGYATAWFMWKLQGASDVRAAFATRNGEFNRANPAWSYNDASVP